MSPALRILVLGPQEAKTPVDTAGVEYHRCADLPDLLGRAGAGAADGALLSPVVAGVDAVVVSLAGVAAVSDAVINSGLNNIYPST